MELLLQTYQATYFTNNSDVTATPPILSMLLTHLSGLSLLPMFGQEVNGFSGEKRQMVIMTDAEQKFRVEFPQGATIFHGTGGTGEEFINKVEGVVRALQSLFPTKKATRLSVVDISYYKDSPEKYSELYRKMFTYHDADPFEWDNRIVEHITLPGSNEKANSGSAVRRCIIQTPFANNNIPSDVINFEVETNTVIENNALRFDFIGAIPVLQELYENNKKLISDLSRYSDK